MRAALQLTEILRTLDCNLMIALLFAAICFLAYSNGANDNFKGVASLFGSGTSTFRRAITWATITTGMGSIAAIFLAQSLLKKFSGKDLVPDVLTMQPSFLLAVALATGATVILATLLGFPISTTHGLTGALVGAGLVNGIATVNFAALTKNFLSPLLLSPLIAVGAGAIVYGVMRFARVPSGIRSERCVCVGSEAQIAPLATPANAMTAVAGLPVLSVTVDSAAQCEERYRGSMIGLTAAQLVDGLHFLSAGAVSFARGLNDTPKIAALLLVASALDIRWGLLAVAVAMAIGGLLNSRKVADTMATKITALNASQGLSANLATALLVTTASFNGLPVSTTHVSVGSLLGIGILTRQAKWKPVIGIVLLWIITLPCAAVLAAAFYYLLAILR